ncbi:MAG: CHASE3 domain-containing protein [Planctomycetes bacterium]|nr:CHASE3 domain-containing protein [Planctomycetota bacterium]
MRKELSDPLSTLTAVGRILKISNAGVVLALALLVTLLIVNTVTTYRNVRRVQFDTARVERAHKLIDAIQAVALAVTTAEAAQRGYVITGDQLYLEPYEDALRALPNALEGLKIAATGREDHQVLVAELIARADERVRILREVVALRAEHGVEAASAYIMGGDGRRVMAATRETIAKMMIHERANLDESTQTTIRESNAAITSWLLTSGATAVLFIGAVLFMRANVLARNRASRALREQHELLRTTLASVVDGIVVTDADGRVTFLNAVAEIMAGCSAREVVGSPVSTVLRFRDEATQQDVENPALLAMRTRTVCTTPEQCVLVASTGTEHAVDASAAPLYDPEENVTGTVLTLHDVAAQRQDKRDIADARAYAERIVDTIPDPLVILEPNLRVRSANLSFYETFGVTRAAVVGRALVDESIGAWGQETATWLARDVLPNGGGESATELEQFVPRRGLRDVVLSARRLRGAGDGEDLILLASRDVTDSRMNERRIAELLASERDNAKRLRQLAAASLSLNSVHTRDRVLDILRDEARSIFGTHEAAIELGPKTRIPAANDLSASLVGRDGQVLGSVQLRADAQRGEPLDENDEALLNQLAVVASVAIENARLYEELRDGDRRKDEFLATLAHELRNPLAPVSNSLMILRSTNADDRDRQQALASIERQVALLVRLVDDLLDVSRITRGKVALKKERIDLAEVVARAIEVSRPIVDASGSSLTVQLPSEPVTVLADPARIAQILSNLVNNAAKYTERGGHIRLEVERHANEIVLRVCDDGIGIPADMLPRIFDMFWQVSHALERAQGGMGIGLSLVRHLVDLHGGSVEARSAGLGQGAEFIVRLPIESQTSAPRALPAPGAVEAHERTRRGHRILVVDDNRDSAESLRVLLGLQGHETCAVHDGEAAVLKADEFEPELILLDIGLPRMNGHDVARAIRARRGTSVMIVAMTGWGQAEDRRRSKEAGFDHHLVKPVDPVLLRKILLELDAPRS